MKKEQKKQIRKFMYNLHIQYLKDRGLSSSHKDFGDPRNKKNLRHRCKIIDLIPKIDNGYLLDIGLGSGRYLFSIAQVRNYNLFSIEHPKMNELLSKQYFKDLIKKFKVNLNRIDITKDKLPYRDDFFDVIMFNNVIEHMQPKDVFPLMKEIHRVLKKGGLLILETPNLFSLIHRIKSIFGIDFGYDLDEINIQNRGYPSHIKEYSTNELKTILKNNNFKIEKTLMSHMQYGKPLIDFITNIFVFFLPHTRNLITITAKKV